MPTSKNLGGVGLAVSSLARSVEFYCDVLGYVPLRTIDTPDFVETILAFPHAVQQQHDGSSSSGTSSPSISAPVSDAIATGGAQLMLMQYKSSYRDGSHAPPKDQLGKIVWYVEDHKMANIMDKCRNKYGCKVYKKPGKGSGAFRDIGMVYDPDGFLIEFVPLRMQGAVSGSTAKI